MTNIAVDVPTPTSVMEILLPVNNGRLNPSERWQQSLLLCWAADTNGEHRTQRFKLETSGSGSGPWSVSFLLAQLGWQQLFFLEGTQNTDMPHGWWRHNADDRQHVTHIMTNVKSPKWLKMTSSKNTWIGTQSLLACICVFCWAFPAPNKPRWLTSAQRCRLYPGRSEPRPPFLELAARFLLHGQFPATKWEAPKRVSMHKAAYHKFLHFELGK